MIATLFLLELYLSFQISIYNHLKEIVLSISFNEILEMTELEKFKSSPEITHEYKSVKEGFHANVIAKTTEKPTANISLDGYILRSENSNIIQARKGSLSFHKVNGYQEFESLLNQLIGIWNLLIKFSNKQLTINKISVRYLNLIEKDKEQSMNDVIKIDLSHPFGENITDKLIVIKYEDLVDSSISGNVTIANQKKANNDSVLLDINLSKAITAKNEFSFELFKELRQIKNKLFFQLITDKTKSKYNS